jgi:5-methylcytosine-specific restriction endonuclease McrA
MMGNVASAGQAQQIVLWCKCGSLLTNRKGVCPRCDRRLKLSRQHFGGSREAALARDEYRCQVCGAFEDVLCHHRRPRERRRDFSTLCRGDHTRLHKLYRLRYGLPRKLKELWHELHPEAPEQLELCVIEPTPRQAPLFQV